MLFEFHPTCCLVRDAMTKEVLVSGTKCCELYKLDFSQMCDRTRSRNVKINVSVVHHNSKHDSSMDMSCFSGQLKFPSSVLR